VEAEESAGCHEGQGKEQDAGIPAPVGRLTRRVTEDERHAADNPEDDEVRSIVLEVRIELRAK
jgi:hypothetical protein